MGLTIYELITGVNNDEDTVKYRIFDCNAEDKGKESIVTMFVGGENKDTFTAKELSDSEYADVDVESIDVIPNGYYTIIEINVSIC